MTGSATADTVAERTAGRTDVGAAWFQVDGTVNRVHEDGTPYRLRSYPFGPRFDSLSAARAWLGEHREELPTDAGIGYVELYAR